MSRVKICGLFRDCDAAYVNAAMPDFAGFVFYPKSHRFVTDAAAAGLRRQIQPQIQTVGVFVDDTIEHIAALYRSGVIQVVQLHAHEDDAYIAALRAELPDAPIWKAFRVRGAADCRAAEASTADMIVLDNGYGTGERFDWTQLSGVRRPFVLAGGLTPETIPEAIARFQPWAVDLSSGVETEQVKDADKIQAAVRAAREMEESS